MTTFGLHRQLFERVGERLESTLITTDHLLLTGWRAVRVCQYLLGTTTGEIERLGVQALDAFARDGASKSVDDAFRQVFIDPHQVGSRNEFILSETLGSKREEVLLSLRKYGADVSELVPKALEVVPALRARFDIPPAALLAGPRHRFELVTAVVVDATAAEFNRRLAAAVLIKLGEVQSESSGPRRLVGLIDDDLVVRVALNEIGYYTKADQLHWTERISALWDDLPFLEGVQFTSGHGLMTTNWLDRINSYVSYTHVLDPELTPLILVQPSVACSPLHSIVSLIGLLVLEGLTSSKNLVGMLQPDRVYEIDGNFHARFDGIAGPPVSGWLRLKFLDGVVFRPATMACRMVPIAERKLSRAKDFAALTTSRDTEPVQRFFNWPEAIGVAAISGRVLFVASRQRAVELFGGVTSNGTSLLDDGLISFFGSLSSGKLLPGSPVVVVPSLTVARQLVDQGENIPAIVVDGYVRLRRGRHDLPFLLAGTTRPSIIVWSPRGYYPSEPPSWLPAHTQLALSPEELSSIVGVDGNPTQDDSLRQESLSVAATGPRIDKRWVDATPTESDVVASILQFKEVVSQSSGLPDYWRHHLLLSATTLRAIVEATPAYWCDIRKFADEWTKALAEQWATLRRGAAAALAHVDQSHRAILAALNAISTERNTKADALLSLVAVEPSEDWFVVCEYPDQVRAVTHLAQRAGVAGFQPVLLRDLEVCRSCVVAGWTSTSFGRRLWAHTPRRVIVLVGESEARHWDRVADEMRKRGGGSLLEAVGHRPQAVRSAPAIQQPRTNEPEPRHPPEVDARDFEHDRVSCLFIWPNDGSDGKIVARNSRILVETGDHVADRRADRIMVGDHVILGHGSTHWSPADEFTEALVGAMEASHPELIRDAKEWRHALSKLQHEKFWSLAELKAGLEQVGVRREMLTIEGWLRLERAAPIGPRHINSELTAIWKLIGSHAKTTVERAATACTQLRSLRSTAGRALIKQWKGASVDLGVDPTWLAELVKQLRQQVNVHEVESVSDGMIPSMMLGWWISPEMATAFELTSESRMSNPPKDSDEYEESDGDA